MVGGQGNDRGVRANGGGDGFHDFSINVGQQLQNLLPTLLAQVGSQDSNQRNGRNQSGDAVNDNIQGNGWPCAYIDRFHELARLVLHLVTPKNKRIERYIYGLVLQIRRMVAAMEPITIRKDMQKAGTLTDEAIRNGSLKKNTKKIGNDGDPSKYMNVRNDNKRTMTENAFTTTANLMRREYTGTEPKCINCNLHHTPESPSWACFNCNCLEHLAKDCRVVPSMVTPINARNPTAARGACFECGGTDHFKATFPRNNGNWARGGAFMLGAKKARHDPNIITSIETSNLGFSYEIEIASRQLVKIVKVIRGCELEIEGHSFDIDLIPFGSGSFDVIVGIDWLSKHKAAIIFHENVVRIPLPNGETLRVVGE
nr:hypothetical protein [Tanacetum cinerariifolium]